MSNLPDLPALVERCAAGFEYTGECADVYEQAKACAAERIDGAFEQSIMREGWLLGYAACYRQFVNSKPAKEAQ